MLKTICTFILLAAGFNLYAQQNLSISGKVMDENGQPMPGTTIFITGTSKSTGADAEGAFAFKNLSPGGYQLVFKMIGYNSVVRDIKLESIALTLNVKLLPNVVQLKAVEIKPDAEWIRWVETFQKTFLGNTRNAGLCKIVNPEVLNFVFDKKTQALTAAADEFLLIDNDALGYRIKYLLKRFEYNYDTGVVAFNGYPSFENLEGSPDDEKRWQKERKKTFYGSMTHFIQSVYNNDLKQQGFSIFKIINRAPYGARIDPSKKMGVNTTPLTADSVTTVADANFKIFHSDGSLLVVYTKKAEPEEFTNYYRSLSKMFVVSSIPSGQVSVINYKNPDVKIDARGDIVPSLGLVFEGIMAWRRMADLLPKDYSPDSLK